MVLVKADDPFHFTKLEAYMSALKSCMSHNFLLLNFDEFNVLVIGLAQPKH